jgi:tetratricopeptide (TPR) repeat protein
LQGEPLKVASDLYALGATLRALPDLDRVPALRALGERCLSASPSDRPSSTGAALVALGALGGGEPLASSVPSALSEALAKDSALVVVELPRGGGRSALAQALVDDAIARGERLMLLPTESERVPWVVLADALGLAGQDPAHRAARAALKLTEPSPSANEPARHFLVDGADRLDEDGRVALLAAARAIAVRALSGERAPRDGRLVVIGVDAPLRAALSMLGALVVEVPQLTEREVARLLASHGARSDEASVRELLACTEGRRGVASELARRLGEVPEASVRDVWHAMDARPKRARPRRPRNPCARAEALLVGGAPRRALSLLRELPVDRITSALSLACELAAGSLEQAELRSVAAIDLAAPEERTGLELSRARILERMGRHAEARALAEELSMRGSRALDRAAACAIAATSALALGAPAEADALAEAGLASLRPTEPESDLESAEPQNAEPRRAELRARLHSLRSDAALRRHQPAQALAFATAKRASRPSARASPLPMAHAIARTAAAHALSGDPQTARAAWRQALRHAEASGEVTALPPYVMNLATADHAAYEVADALAGYERAASLAARLGRRGSRAAALTNLGNLFGMIGADGEALSVLSEAEREAESAGVPLYAAQAKLFAAEVLAASDPSRAAREVSAADDGVLGPRRLAPGPRGAALRGGDRARPGAAEAGAEALRRDRRAARAGRSLGPRRAPLGAGRARARGSRGRAQGGGSRARREPARGRSRSERPGARAPRGDPRAPGHRRERGAAQPRRGRSSGISPPAYRRASARRTWASRCERARCARREERTGAELLARPLGRQPSLALFALAGAARRRRAAGARDRARRGGDPDPRGARVPALAARGIGRRDEAARGRGGPQRRPRDHPEEPLSLEPQRRREGALDGRAAGDRERLGGPFARGLAQRARPGPALDPHGAGPEPHRRHRRALPRSPLRDRGASTRRTESWCRPWPT